MSRALPRFDPAADGEFAAALLEGLCSSPKRIPCKYFYDERGSELFDEICRLPEYYQTRTEVELLRSHSDEIAGMMGADATVVEFGAGASRKVELFLDALERPRAYVPVDISGDYLSVMLSPLRRSHPSLAIVPVIDDFTKPITLPTVGEGERRVGFFPGSTIGNMDPDDALAFLDSAARLLKGGGLLVGVDLVKNPAVLHAAYNDSAGVTAAFNRNVLVRANHELGTQFEPEEFSHYAYYNPVRQRIEMHLISHSHQSVALCGRRIFIAQGETVHTENSYKFTLGGFRALASRAGFHPRAAWTDARQLFSLHWLEAPA